jgi:N5-(cytidine 5'-diphosphoramidyl)-L-glutamine hydrolase
VTKVVAITQRVVVVPEYGERRDCLDQAWPKFLAACGLMPLALPNVLGVALELCERTNVRGVVLTGGNDLAQYGGDAPERDAVELALLGWAEQHRFPVLGVCRGMQLIQQRFGIDLCRVDGHVTQRQIIHIDGEPSEVNSFHHLAAFETRPPLDVWAIADDRVIKAIRHSTLPITGVMWHPERCSPFSTADVAMFRKIFKVE